MSALLHNSALIAIAMLLSCVSSIIGATIGPLPYTGIADSPFDRSRLGIDFFVEDFSWGITSYFVSESPPTFGMIFSRFSTPGAYAAGAYSGRGQRLNSFPRLGWEEAPTALVTLVFDQEELSWLPQVVGFVTSNQAPVTISFYSPNGALLDTLSVPAAALPDPLPSSGNIIQVGEHARFFGIVHRHGVSRVVISTSMVTTFVDDLQYGRLVPEPSSLTFAAGGLILLSALRWRKPGT